MLTSHATQAYRLVIIDDQPEFLQFAREELQQSGAFNIVGEVTDGNDALAVIEKTQPDAVLVDIFMPGKNGLEIARRILAAFPSIVIVYLSVDNVMQYPTMREQLGDLTFVSKKWFSERYLLAIFTHYRRSGWKPPSWSHLEPSREPN
ncbi:response regulator transcription factor [Sulfobacillus harzensis]|uniref:Stage 0 sporulation protein A homolog n=1 Tax=Sulfobacillus harzensis TaxID=2729629 RepID=A0A7Y0L8P8_9FIRM|nr:response regulator transcription factor [Sulfobacillus harzensis]NMP24540.1 response regulator [Sulfobacillus harzensis]